ncbi:hypothetical protein [Paraliomyxa miuraensis]|uniref:hypothetical protein n=1 Tax=Paraliomyxa miuraensis TaxID=376150 RepID=UPI00225159C7|nr:hypothetical protein [Paraliomyxa miuraensis]MCX4241591.1 hypothetical protein [Paraliomyxa miuraensis]
MSLAETILDAMKDGGVEPLPQYAACLRDAFAAAPPPFERPWYGKKFFRLAKNKQWLAESLVGNSNKEGIGSRSLWRLAGCAADERIADLVRLHAIDESRHALLYVSLLDMTFAITPEIKSRLQEHSPRFGKKDRPERAVETQSEWRTLDELIQMNIGEIRTRVNQTLFRPALLGYAVEEHHEPVGKVMDRLLADETAHIAYTARLLEEAMSAGKGAFVRDTMKKRLSQFNDITHNEVGSEEEFEGS